jgi:hypothetical protein
VKANSIKHHFELLYHCFACLINSDVISILEFVGLIGYYLHANHSCSPANVILVFGEFITAFANPINLIHHNSVQNKIILDQVQID